MDQSQVDTNSSADGASFGDDEVLLYEALVEYRAPGSIIVRKGSFLFTNYRLCFRPQFRKRIHSFIEYKDINYVRKFLVFGVWIYLKDGRKASLRLLGRKKFMDEMKNHVTVE